MYKYCAICSLTIVIHRYNVIHCELYAPQREKMKQKDELLERTRGTRQTHEHLLKIACAVHNKHQRYSLIERKVNASTFHHSSLKYENDGM